MVEPLGKKFKVTKEPNKKNSFGKKHLQSSKLPDFERGRGKNNSP
jgi:hypothetical protein